MVVHRYTRGVSSTTIKVSRSLRDRLAERAKAQHTTLAGAIEQALDASDEEHFWAAVRREHEALPPEQRAAYLSSGGSDDLDDTDDERLSTHEQW